MDKGAACVQFGVWPNCCNVCDFCLRKERIPISKAEQLKRLRMIQKNIEYIDWKDKFSYGISLLGGELYYIRDKELQCAFLELIDTIIEKILKVSTNPSCKYSTVTNGLYDPDFLYKVIDKIVDAVGIEKVDLNFSYDLKYRYSTPTDQQLVLKNINAFHTRYKYKVGVQMILTQYLIDMWKNKEFTVSGFIKENIPGNTLNFLYPHKVRTGKKLTDFFFKRDDFLQFITSVKVDASDTYYAFLQSVVNSSLFKYTGLKEKESEDESPVLSDGKEVLNKKCGHSILYQCYSDSKRCMLCDLMLLDQEVFI